MPERTYAVHAPALSLPEAAMLPALAREDALPRNLVLPDRRTYYPMPAPPREQPPCAPRTMAGRAVLTAVQRPFPKKKGRV